MIQQHRIRNRKNRVPECVFCRIIQGAAPAHVLVENDQCIAFLDKSPLQPGHTLVVPKAHTTAFDDLDPRMASSLMPMAQSIARALKIVLGCPGTNLFLTDGAAAGQEVMHAHMHVIPRHLHDRVFQIRSGTQESQVFDVKTLRDCITTLFKANT